MLIVVPDVNVLVSKLNELVIVHPANFVSWSERGFRISVQSIRQTFAKTPKP
jgi:hypothetical protein